MNSNLPLRVWFKIIILKYVQTFDAKDLKLMVFVDCNVKDGAIKC